MDLIKSKWRFITIVYFAGSYVLFELIMKNHSNYLTLAIMSYIVITLVFFIGTFIGIPGMLIHSILKKEKVAMPFYQLAVTLGSTNTNILAAYGILLLKDFRPQEALEVFERAKASTKQFLYHKTLTANMALCHWKIGNTALALETYETLYLYPDLKPITDFSLENLEEGTDKNPNFYAQDFITLAYIAILEGLMEKALYYTHVGLKLLDHYGPAYDNLGQIAYLQGNYEEAKTQFIKGLEYKKGMMDSIYYLALLYYMEGNKDVAKKYADQLDISRINGLSTITVEEAQEIIAKIEAMHS